MLKEKFIDLLNFSEEDKKDDDDENLNPILKEDLAQNLDNSEIVGEREVLENDEFVINVSKIDGVLSEMEIECKCGKKTSITFDYFDEEADGVKGMDQSAERSDLDEPGEEDEGPAEFVEGIPAQTLYELPDDDAGEDSDVIEEETDQDQ